MYSLCRGEKPKAIHRRLQLCKEKQVSCSQMYLSPFRFFLWRFTGKKLSVNFWFMNISEMFCLSMGILNPFIAGRKQFYELKFMNPGDKLPPRTMKQQVTPVFTGQEQTLEGCQFPTPEAHSFFSSVKYKDWKLRGARQLRNHFLVIQCLYLFV